MKRSREENVVDDGHRSKGQYEDLDAAAQTLQHLSKRPRLDDSIGVKAETANAVTVISDPVTPMACKIANVSGLSAGTLDLFCDATYNELGVPWIVSDEELWQPEPDEDATKDLEALALDHLSRLPRDRAINVARGMHRMKDDLVQFLGELAGKGKSVVSVEDVNEFIEQKMAKFRGRRTGPAHF
ncbi:hypothetical protein HDU93_009655 [Gonapodya sp. JEL0774]|nr:hypothetical protein HDU93_009655 [Gonapodya sp. JEL0774]